MQDIIIQFQKVLEHYEVYVNGEFVQSCDASEVSEVRNELKGKYQKVAKTVAIYL